MRLLEKLSQWQGFVRKAWALSSPYFGSDEKWRARGLLATIVALNLGAVYMLVLLNEWNRVFYDALQNKNAPVFWEQLARFTALAFGYILIAVYRFYLTQLLELRWRAWLSARVMDRWLGMRAFYRMELMRFTGQNAQSPDNPDQRIQEDLGMFTASAVSLSMGLLNASVTLVSFVGILWTLSGSFGFVFQGQDFTIPGFMVWMAVVYAVLGSVLTHYIGRPLAGINFEQQRREANFRHHLVRVREYSEAIALDRGEAVERHRLGRHFKDVLDNSLRLIQAQKRLTWFTVGFNQAAVVFPFVVAAPRFFSGAIQLGQLMQIASAFNRVQDALSWLVDNYDAMARWQATTERLTGFADSLDTHPHAELALEPSGQNGLEIGRLQLTLPSGEPLLLAEGLQLHPGDRVLVSGASGSGKSSLFRALAGIWPYAQGHCRLPADFASQAMFLPQRPYFPTGSLRAALAYPDSATAHSQEALEAALRTALLPQWVADLDREDNWGQKLSGGEQQRLAIARALLKRPRWLFADEATSALDAESEQAVYRALQTMLTDNGGALVSIAHRPSVAAFHGQRWQVEAGGKLRALSAVMA